MTVTLEEKGLLYEPAPAVALSFTEAFNKIVPLAPNGERYLRFVWGCDRLEFCAGFWERRYGDLDNDPPKYLGRCRFVLEGWQSPDVYQKADWDEKLLGEWPSRGVWDFIAIHADADGNYLPLDETALALARNWKYWRSKGQARSVEELMEKRMLRLSLQEMRRQQAAEKVSMQFGEDAVKIMENQTNPEYSLPGGYKATESGILVKA